MTKSDTISYYLIGEDAKLFEMDENGEIRFKTPPDYENPVDSDGDNIYNLTIVAGSETGDITSQDISIVIEDIDDTPPTFQIPDTISLQESTDEVLVINATDVDSKVIS